jgi:hypothetical protein
MCKECAALDYWHHKDKIRFFLVKMGVDELKNGLVINVNYAVLVHQDMFSIVYKMSEFHLLPCSCAFVVHITPFSRTCTEISHLEDFKHGLGLIYHFTCYC